MDQVKDALPRGTSALILVAEKATAEELVSAVGTQGRKVLRQPMTDEQVEQLKQAAARATASIS